MGQSYRNNSKNLQKHWKKAVEAAEMGLTYRQIAKIIDTPYDTFLEWIKFNSDFKADIKDAALKADLEVFQGLKKSAKGQKLRLQKNYVVSDGKDNGSHVEQHEEEVYYAPNPKSTIFWLCNRHPDRFTMKQEVDVRTKAQSLSDEELKVAVAKALKEQEESDDDED